MSFKQKLFKISRQLLVIWGGISLIGVIAIGCFVLYSMTIGNTNVQDKATKSDVKFVLNWCGLGDQRIDKVLNSYTSARSFTGDHLDAYAIQITNVTVDELANHNQDMPGQWYRMDSLPTVLNEAVSFIGGWQHETPWFPKEDSLRTRDFYVYPWSIYCHGVTPTATELIFVKPKDKMVYYVSAKCRHPTVDKKHRHIKWYFGTAAGEQVANRRTSLSATCPKYFICKGRHVAEIQHL